MAAQGFFSPDKKTRMAGEKENNSFFSVKVEPVKVANNINQYNEQTPSLDYAPDRVESYIKESEERPTYKSTYEKQQEEAKKVEKFYGLDPRGITYTPRDESKYEGSVIKSSLGLPDKTLTTKERILGTKPIGYREDDGLTINPIKFDKGTAYGIGLNLDFKNKYGLTKDPIFGGSMFSDDPVTQSYVKAIAQSESDSLATEDRLRKEQLAAKEQAKIDEANARFEKISQDFLNDPAYKERLKKFNESESESPVKDETSTVDKVFGFLDALGQVKRVGPDATNQESTTEDTGKLATMPSMGISEEGRKEAEKNRLEKAKEEGENRNVLQKVGDFVGDTFNKLTGIDSVESAEAAVANMSQPQGINTGATVKLSQIGNVSPTVQAARDAVARSNLRKSGLNRTVGGQSSQANYGRASQGFGTGTHGKGMPSNPKGFSGYSRRKSSTGTGTGTSTSKSKGSTSTSRSRGQGPGSNSTSRSRGGTGTGRSSQGRGGRRGGSTGGSGASSKGGVSRGGRKGTTGRGGRRGGSRRCDIRCKFDISLLTNMNLVRDDLAELAYFVQEIKK